MSRGSRYLRRVVWFVLPVAFTARLSFGQESAPVVARVSYEAPAGCPDAAAFKLQIQRRTPRFVDDVTRAPALVLSVSLTGNDKEMTGTLDVISPSGERSRRSIAGASCVEVTDALALMAALAIDPLALASSHAPVPDPVAPPPPPAPAPTARPAALQAPDPLSPPAHSPPPPIEPVERTTPRTSQPRPGSRWEFAAGAGANLSSGVTPDVLLGPVVFLEVASPHRGLFGVSIRAGFERATASDVVNAGGAASFTWTLGTVDACPLRWTRGSFSLSPCARMEAGELDGSGANIPAPNEAKRGWLALAALGRASWTPIRHLAVELEGARGPLSSATVSASSSPAPSSTDPLRSAESSEPTPVSHFGDCQAHCRTF